MSARCSNSPSLRLRIADSRIHRVLHGLLCLLLVAGLCLLSLRGYPLAGLLLLPAVGWGCRQLARQHLAGACISWQLGEWMLEQGGSRCPITLRPGSTCLPWVIHLAWVEAASERRGAVFLFADSAAAEDLRRLRVRLTLER